MAKLSIPLGSTSFKTRVKLRHATTGVGLTGLTFSSSGLIISTITDNEPTPTVYTQGASTIETVTTLGTWSAPTATKCRFREVDATNHKGVYEIQLADARLAVANAKELVITISGATNLMDADIEVQFEPMPTDGYAILSNVTYGNQNIHTHAELVEDKIDVITGLVAASAIADAVWDALTAGHVTEDTFGELMSFIYGFSVSFDGRLTSARAGYLDNLNVGGLVASGADMTTVLSRLTSARAGYLDNLNVGGLVASAANVTAILQASRLRIVIPDWLERPDAGSTAFRVWIYVYDEQHKAEDLDSNPTVTAENGAGTDRSANLGTVTKPGATTGQYYVDYTVASGHALEQIVFKVTATEGAVATIYPAVTLIVDTTAADFTSSDRAMLTAFYNKIPTKLYLAGTNNSDGDIESNEMTGNYPGTVGGIAGTITTLDGLDTAQDAQHATTQAAVSSLASTVGGIATDVTTLLSRITSTLFSGITSLAMWMRVGFRSGTPDATALSEINSGGGTFAGTMSQQGLKTAIDGVSGGGGGGTGSGARTVALTVTDADDVALEGARIRLTKGAETYIGSTDIDGLLTFNIDDGTWTVAITLAGFTFAGTTLAVADDVTTTYELADMVISPSAPTLTTGYLVVYDQEGVAEAGVTITAVVREPADGATGAALDETPYTAVSDVAGLVEFPNLFPGTTYTFKRGTSEKTYIVTVPADAGATYELPSMIGN